MTTSPQPAKALSIEYLAGFFDGEGCFYLGLQKGKKNDNLYPKAQVMLSQSGESGKLLLEKIMAEFGGKMYLHLKPGQYKATKTAYKVWWNKDEAIVLIKLLLPHLIIKYQEALEVLNYLQRK